jgi:hypothetical protein
MTKSMVVGMATVAALAGAGALQAHHSGSMYETTPVWITGTVVSFEPIDPHTITTIEGRSENGQVYRWAVEGRGQSQRGRMGVGMDIPKVGDVIGFCAFPYKSPEALSRMFPGVDFSARPASADSNGPAPQFVAGHVMTLPDGEKRIWEPHGILSECMRSTDDQRQLWLDFLRAEPEARQAWCGQRGYQVIQSNASLREFVAEIDGSMAGLCD